MAPKKNFHAQGEKLKVQAQSNKLLQSSINHIIFWGVGVPAPKVQEQEVLIIFFVVIIIYNLE